MIAKLTSSLTAKTVIGMALGILVGILMHDLPETHLARSFVLEGVFYVVGQMFVASLKMLVVPLVFFSLVSGVANLDDMRRLSRVGLRTIGLYVLTTALAISLAIMIAQLIGPGLGFDLPTEVTFQEKSGKPLRDVLVNIVPSNPIQAAAEGEMLQVIFFSILFGMGLTAVKDKAQPIAALIEAGNEVIMKMIVFLMNLAPYGVAALIATVFANEGLGAIQMLGKYFLTVVLALLLHVTLVYTGFLTLLCRLNPKTFFIKMKETLFFAFSTASSNATIPVTMRTVTERLGVARSTASFTVPLGATINMDGTAIMQGVATVFIAQAYNIELSLSSFLMVVMTATLSSVGTAGVPGVGLITLAMVLRQVGLPVEGIGLIIGVDRILDMIRTAVNVSGDAMVSCAVAKSEGQFNDKVFNDHALDNR